MALLAQAQALRRAKYPVFWCDIKTINTAPQHGTLLFDHVDWPTDPTTANWALSALRSHARAQNVILALRGHLPPALRDEWIAGRAALFQAQDLSLSEHEAAQMFGLLEPSRETRLLRQMFEGWALGLALASRDPSEARRLVQRHGSRLPLPKALSDWFSDMVAQRLAPVNLARLMDLATFDSFPIALLGHMPTPICPEALSPLLDEALFLHHDPSRLGWWRFQPAFGRYLRQRLSLHDPARAETMRAFALAWAKKHDDNASVIRLTLEGMPAERALSLADASRAIAVSLGSGPDFSLALPIDAARAKTTPMAFFALIYERVRLGCVDEARIHYENARALTQNFRALDCPHDPDLIRVWMFAFEAIFFISDDQGFDPAWCQAMHEHCHRLISRDPEAAVTLSTVLTLIPHEEGHRDAALANADLGLRLHARFPTDKSAIFIHLHRSTAQIAAADPGRASNTVQDALHLATRESYADSYELLACQIHAGLCQFENDDVASAAALLEPCYEHLPHIHGWRSLWTAYFGALAEMAADSRGLAHGLIWLERGRDFAQTRRQPHLRRALDLVEADLYLRHDHLAAAAARVRQTFGEGENDADLPLALAQRLTLTRAEIAIKAGDTARAQTHLDTWPAAQLSRSDRRLEVRHHAAQLAVLAPNAPSDAWIKPYAALLDLASRLPRLARLPQIANMLRAYAPAARSTPAALSAQGLRYLKALPQPQHPNLSPREQQIIALIVEGMATKEIARHLGISEGTVKSHRKNMYEKLQVNTRSKVIARAKELALI